MKKGLDKKTYKITVITKGGEVFSWMNQGFDDIYTPFRWLSDRIQHEAGMIQVPGDKGTTFINVDRIARIDFVEVDDGRSS